MLSHTKLAVSMATTFMLVGVVRAWMPGGPAETQTNNEIQQVQTTVSNSIEEFGTSFSENLIDKFEQILGAIAVATKQEAVGGNTIAEAHREAGEMMINAAKAQQTNAELMKAVVDYAPGIGQGHDPCGTLSRNKAMAGAHAGVPDRARATVANLDAAPGRLVQSVPEAMEKRLALHREKFCTKAEADAGLCTESELPGGDVNAALLFEPAPAESLKSEARNAYIQHVVGTPNPRVQPEAGKTPNGQNYMVSQNRLDAMRSAAAYSLAIVDASNTQSVQMSDGTMASPNELLKQRVNQYFGGKDAQNWSAAMAAQSARGLMVESTKMAGLSAWMEFDELKRLHRMNVLYANILLSNTETLKPGLNELYQSSLSDAVSGAIR